MPTRNVPSLADETWLQEPRLQKVLATLNVGGETRVAGGAVRNALLGVAVADIDLATTLLPAEVMSLAKAAGFGVHPTGLEHGTVTLTNNGAAFEVTTLRRDVETDGRRAVVSFTTDWAEDAVRRDFTINAMYCDGIGKIYDFTNGYDDILKRKVRFVGDASARIREDYLRILRFFRFHAYFGKGSPDVPGFNACVKLKSGLKKLSAERVRQELLKLLVAPHAVRTLKRMAEAGILKIVLPHTDDWRVLGRLPDDAILRLAVLSLKPLALKETLRLSNADAARLLSMVAAPTVSPALLPSEQRRMLYQLGPQVWRDTVLLSAARSRARLDDAAWRALLDLPQNWDIPAFPVKGNDLLQTGFAAGPKLGQLLTALEDWWLANDFNPSRDDLIARAQRYKFEP
jgi:poly(A) polymerase